MGVFKVVVLGFITFAYTLGGGFGCFQGCGFVYCMDWVMSNKCL